MLQYNNHSLLVIRLRLLISGFINNIFVSSAIASDTKRKQISKSESFIGNMQKFLEGFKVGTNFYIRTKFILTNEVFSNYFYQ